MKRGSQKKNGIIKFGENIIIIWILVKSRSVAPVKLQIKLVWPKKPVYKKSDLGGQIDWIKGSRGFL